MTAMEEVVAKAQIFGWSLTEDYMRTTLIRGDQMLDVSYSKDGSIREAKRYDFFSINSVHLREETGSRYRKERVFSWLAA